MVDTNVVNPPTTVERFDAAPIRGKAEPDEWGNLHIPAMFVTEGVFPYRRHDGTVVREYKPAEEIYAPAFMESLRASTLTDGHPPFAVTPANSSEYSRGHVRDNLAREDAGLVGEVVAKEAKLIAKVNAREATQVSVGLDCVIDPTPGTWVDPQGKAHRYDCIQRHMKANHVAIVKTARVPTANLRLDSAEMIVEPTEKVEPMTTPSLMRLDVGDNASVEVPADVGQPIKLYIASLLSAGRMLKSDHEKLQARFDASEEKLAASTKENEDHKAVDVDALVAARTDCLAGARKLMKPEAVGALVTAGKTNAEIRLAACDAKGKDLKDRNPDYIESRFDSLVEDAGEAPKNDQAAQIAGIVNGAQPEPQKSNQVRLDEAFQALRNLSAIKAVS